MSEPFIIERLYAASAAKVWQAITDKDQMKEWYFDVPEFKAEKGFEFTFTGKDEGESYKHLCRVLDVVPGKKLSYSWRYEGYEGNSIVTFEIFDEGKKSTRLKLTHQGLETFPQNLKSFARENFVAGWNMIIGTMLKDYVETVNQEYSAEILAPANKVWELITTSEIVNQWASAFSEGAYIETEWKKGDEVIWKDATGDIGARGVIQTSKKPELLRVQFYDEVKPKQGEVLGEYLETFQIYPQGEGSRLSIKIGPLPRKNDKEFQDLWSKAIANIKDLAEKS